MKLGFVVLTYNRPDALLAVLNALAPQCPPDAMVVVADDGSRPENVEAVRAGLPRFPCAAKHVWHPDIGFTAARARNLGAVHAGADYVVFLDGDCVPGSGFVAHHRQLAQAGHFVNGSRVLLSAGLSGRVLRREIDLDRLTALDWMRLRLAGDVNKLTHLLYWPALPGRVQDEFEWSGIRSCNFGVWYRDLQAVNGFDESFSGWGHEDADLVLRLHHQGLRRKSGHLATEVYHLWHPENNRAAEAANREKVHRRMKSGITRAEIGMAEALGYSTTIVTELNQR
jgi:GT2 family glycosyltransferase